MGRRQPSRLLAQKARRSRKTVRLEYIIITQAAPPSEGVRDGPIFHIASSVERRDALLHFACFFYLPFLHLVRLLQRPDSVAFLCAIYENLEQS